MIYYVTLQTALFDMEGIELLSVEDSLLHIKSWNVVQFDTETSGRDAHICSLLCMQFGNDTANERIVVDCTTINPILYKEVLEDKLVIGQNLKFDLQFLYNYKIVPLKVYDTMIVEQLIYLGYPSGQLSMSLKEISWRRLQINIDKTVRGEIIWRGLDRSVILYAAGDVTYLEKIAHSQMEDLKKQDLMKASRIECNFVPVMAYLEWCGIHLDQTKWKTKMANDREALNKAHKELNEWFLKYNEEHNNIFRKYIFIDRQGDLFTGFNTEPQVSINWSSSDQVINIAKLLGFDTQTQDKKTGEDKDSVMEKQLKSQKGICDDFLNYYFTYQGCEKVCTSFGQGHLNAINPKTNRIHTNYWQMGCFSGRMSCGSSENNNDLAKYKGLPINPSAKQKKAGLGCSYPNMQQLPADEVTRSCFTAPEGYLWCSCDFSALESRLGADIYNEKSMLDEFLYGSQDMHSLCAYMIYKNEIPRDTPISDIKKKYKHLRSEVKPIEFSQQFGGSASAIKNAMGCTMEEAEAFEKAYAEGFPGIADFKKRGAKFVKEHGYILMCKYSGHKAYWWDWKYWNEVQQEFNEPGFWDNYRPIKEKKKRGEPLTREEQYIYEKVKLHFKAGSKYDRLALNAPTQGSGIVILKIAMTNFLKWIVDNNYFGIVELAALVHDESNVIFPKELENIVPPMQKKCMEDAAALICTKLPIPAEPAIGDHWIH